MLHIDDFLYMWVDGVFVVCLILMISETCLRVGRQVCN